MPTTPRSYSALNEGNPLPTAVQAETPIIDDCPVLTRIKLYVVTLGVIPTIEHVFRDRNGQPLNVESLFTTGSEGSVVLRIKEIVSPAGPHNPAREIGGTCIDPASGVAQFNLDAEMVKYAGVYQLSVALKNHAGAIKHIDNPVLWIERSLFSLDASDRTYNSGPPTLQELRQAIMDNGSAENLLLDDVEFHDDQIAYAVGKPLAYWNETPPPLKRTMDTRIFPFREAWTNAICGHLFMIAAHNYRRNHLPYNAGGVAVDDRNKEPQYLQMGTKLLEEWKDFVRTKKYEINTSLFTGSVSSIYGGLFH